MRQPPSRTRRLRLPSSAAPAAATAPAPASSESTGGLPPDVFAKTRWTEITRADYDRALSKLPEKMRWEFATSPKRVQDILNNLLLIKTLAAQARLDGLTPVEPRPRAKGNDAKDSQAPDRALANAELAHLDEVSGKNFDADRVGFEKKAREIYTVDRDKYKLPELRQFSDIAVSITTHGDDGAKLRAEAARAKILAGGDWDSVTREYSDDPTTKGKGGVLPPMSEGQLPAEIKDGLLALKKPGELSPPLKTSVAWHIARLDAIHPPRTQAFDEVRDKIMKTLREQYIASQRNLRYTEINRDPTLRLNQPAIDALVNRVDANGNPLGPAVPPGASSSPASAPTPEAAVAPATAPAAPTARRRAFGPCAQVTARTGSAAPGQPSAFGQKVEVKGILIGPSGRTGDFTTVGLLRTGEDFPRLVTAIPR